MKRERDDPRRRAPARILELSVVVPVYNEEAIIPELSRRLASTLDELALAAEVILVDDGSLDGTADAIAQVHSSDPRFTGLVLARNFGHQVAISAGLDRARGEIVAVLDGDLQDPPEALIPLIDTFNQGYDVVYAVRARRPEPLWKRLAYAWAYRLIHHASEISLPRDVGDFAVMSRRVVDVMTAMPERRRYLRGLRAWVGFRQTGLPIDRHPRHAGRPKYTLAKLAGLALDGLISFAAPPLRLAGILGMVILLIALIGATASLVLSCLGTFVGGSVWLAWVLLFLGGTQLVCASVLGEYLDRIHQNVAGRPLYVVRSWIGRGRSRRRDQGASTALHAPHRLEELKSHSPIT